MRALSETLRKSKSAWLAAALLSVAFIPAACQKPQTVQAQRAAQPLPAEVQRKMAQLDMPLNSPIMLRLFKEESVMEVWKQKRDGRYAKIAQYDICKWSGKLGPKYMEGDRQAPEGYYNITRAQMNPNSRYYLSFDLGFPNAYDRAHNRTGSHLMVHGSCSSSGCYSMTDKSVAEIYAFGRDSFMGGQRSFQVEAFPFRMTDENMARYRKDPNYPFWAMLKQGYDSFEQTKIPPKVDVCDGVYVFNHLGGCAAGGALQSAYAANLAKSMNAANAAFGGLFHSLKAPSPSILSRDEAALVADWSHRRAAGQAVSAEPPSLTRASAEKQGAPDVAATHRMMQIRSVKVNGQIQKVAVIYKAPANSAEVRRDQARVKALSRPGALAALSAKAAAGGTAPAGAAPQMALAEAAPAAETGFIRQQSRPQLGLRTVSAPADSVKAERAQLKIAPDMQAGFVPGAQQW